MTGPCDLHELSNCGLCNGDAKRLEGTLIDDAIDTSAPLPLIPGGVSTYARFPGNCDGCGRRYPQDTPIFRPSDNRTGWVVIECCLDRAI